MRFRFLKPRRDVASAEQVRALRERRGWTLEQLADEVHASALEVSAWEAGVVAVPSNQALLIRWLTDVDEWRAALDDARGQSCAWVPEHAPDLYEGMFRVPWGDLLGEGKVREHVSGCAACQTARERARQLGGYPAKPDTSGSLRARYRRWVDRLPERVQWPFMAAGLGVGAMLPLSFVAFWAPDVWVGFALGWVAFWLTIRIPFMGRAWVVPSVAGLTAGLLGWSVFPGNSLSDPAPWMAVAGLVAAIGAGELWLATAGKRRARPLAAGPSPRPALSPPPPDLAAPLQRDPAAARTTGDAPRR